jgi:hypothetical protein
VHPPEYDPFGIRMHLGLWAAPMNGAIGSGMFWWWDIYVHPSNQYPHIAGLAAFFDGEDLAAENYQLVQASAAAPARLYGLQSERRLLLWLLNEAYHDGIYDGLSEEPSEAIFPEICDARIVLHDLQAGTYVVSWWDTITGLIVQTTEAEAVGDSLELVAPCFRRDLAIKIQLTGD